MTVTDFDVHARVNDLRRWLASILDAKNDYLRLRFEAARAAYRGEYRKESTLKGEANEAAQRMHRLHSRMNQALADHGELADRLQISGWDDDAATLRKAIDGINWRMDFIHLAPIEKGTDNGR